MGDIAGETVRRMEREYGTRPEDLIGAIGPSICQDCYQVSQDVIDQVKEAYPADLWPEIFKEDPLQKAGEKKYRLNLWGGLQTKYDPRRNASGADRCNGSMYLLQS